MLPKVEPTANASTTADIGADEGPATPTETQAGGSPSAAVEPDVDQRRVFVNFARSFNRVFDRCNDAFEPMAEEAGSSSPNIQRLYDISRNAKDVCASVSLEIGRLSPPASLDRAMKSKLEDIIDNCSLAAVAQQMTADSAMKAIDDAFRPSRVSTMQENSDHALQSKLGCVAGWMTAAQDIGVPTDELFVS